MPEKQVKIKFDAKVTGIEVEKNKVKAVTYIDKNNESKKLLVDKVILATGGFSYQSTGSTGDGYRFAKELGLKYFLMLDDDYKEIDFRYVNGNKLSAKPARQMDRIFEDMLRFLDVSGAATVAFAQGGDFVGGLDGGNFKKGLLRKAMNSLFCRTDRPIDFRGTMNEDVTTYTTLGSRGRLFFTLCNMCVIQIPTQSLDGGMTESYLETGTYVKTFYSVMAMPSCIKVSMMYTKHKRIHHRIDWECCVPKIINEKYRKEVR